MRLPISTSDHRQSLVFKLPERREDGGISVAFDGAQGKDVDVDLLLEVVRAAFGVTIASTPFSPYDYRLELALREHRFLLIADTWGCWLIASAADAATLEAMILGLAGTDAPKSN